MSWHLKFVAKSKEAAKTEIDKAAAQPQTLPPKIAEIIKERIDALPDPSGDGAILIETTGHIDSSPGYGAQQGNATFTVTLITLRS